VLYPTEGPYMCDDCRNATDANITVDDAIKTFKNAHTNLTFNERLEFASAYLRRILGLKPDIPVVGRLRALAQSRGVASPSEVIDEYCNKELTALAVEQVIEISREHGLATYDARLKDKENIERFEISPFYLQQYISNIGGTFCLADDKNRPF
jgi:hypothetical protein